MPLITDIVEYFKSQALYMTGRGLLSASLIAAAFIPGGPITLLALVTGSALLQGWVVWQRQCRKEDQMVNDYRDEIAARLGIDPTRVTAAHMHIVAYGDPSRGLEGNYIMAQSLERSGTRKLVGLLSTVASAFITLGAVLLFASEIQNVLKPVHDLLVNELHLGFVQKELRWFAPLIVSGTGMGLVNRLTDYTVEAFFGLNRRTAQSLIREIRRDVDMNKTISQEQVFGVFVAANPGLDRIIETRYGKPYYELDVESQSDALAQYGRSFQNPAVTKRTIAQLAQDINNRQIEADELVFAVVNQESGIPRLNQPQPVGPEKTRTQQMQQELQMAVRGEHKTAEEKSRDLARERQVAEEIANDNQPGFSERFAPRQVQASHDEAVPSASHGVTHVERFAVRGAVPTMSHVQKELERAMQALDEPQR